MTPTTEDLNAIATRGLASALAEFIDLAEFLDPAKYEQHRAAIAGDIQEFIERNRSQPYEGVLDLDALPEAVCAEMRRLAQAA